MVGPIRDQIVRASEKGMVAAYALPWNGNLAQGVKPYSEQLVRLDVKPMRNVVVRE